MNMDDRTVYLTMTYDVIDGPLPAGWMDIKPVWFDANQCGTSEVNPPKQNGQFTITRLVFPLPVLLINANMRTVELGPPTSKVKSLALEDICTM
jgi:hypothetical protein